jgi:hypothetical protein
MVTDPGSDYQLVEGTTWDDLDDQDANGVLSQEFAVPFVMSTSQSRRLAKIEMAKRNPRWRFDLVCNYKALNALSEPNVSLQYSLAGIDESFHVTAFKLDTQQGTLSLSLISLDATAYEFDATLEDAPPPSYISSLPAGTPDVPIITVFSGEAASGFATVSNPHPVVITHEPGAGNTVPIATYEDNYRLVGEMTWNSISASSATATSVIPGYDLGDDLEIRSRAISTAGIAGGWTVTIMHVNGGLGASGPITSLLALGQNVGLGSVSDAATVFEGLGSVADAASFSVGLGSVA